MSESQMRGVRQTSLQAYYELDRKTLTQMERQVFGCIIQHPEGVTDREIAFFLGYTDPNKVRPRRNALMKTERITELGKRSCSRTGKTSIIWGAI